MLRRCIYIAVTALILKTVFVTVLLWNSYIPADFATDFLRGREPYFFGTYQYAFYTHIFTGPIISLESIERNDVPLSLRHILTV